MDEIIPLGANLFGLLSRPPAASRSTCVVLLNAGFLPRSGPFRLYVRLARRLAALGYPVVRFDLPSVGDSVAHADRSQVLILQEVLDAIQARCGYTRFALGGICSATDLAWPAALADARVSGLIVVDGIARATLSHALSRLLRALRMPLRAWPGKLRRMFAQRGQDLGMRATESLRDWPAAGAERGQLRALLDRGVELYFLYTGGTAYFLHRRQFVETFGAATRSPQVVFAHWPQCDHLFYDERDRADLIAGIGAWLERRLPE